MDILINIGISIILTILLIIYCEKIYVKKDVYYNDISVRALRESELKELIEDGPMVHPKELVEAAKQELKNREKIKLKNL